MLSRAVAECTPEVAQSILDATPCLCKSWAMHLDLHPGRVYIAEYTPPDALYDACPDALDPDCGMPRVYHGPPAGMDRRYKGALGAPRPLQAPTDLPLPFDPYRPYALKEDVQLLARLPVSPIAQCLYLVLAGFHNWNTGACFPSRATIHHALTETWGAKVTDHLLRKALAELRRTGLISWDRGGEGHSNRYRFHLTERLVDAGLRTWTGLIALITRGKAKSPSNSVVRRKVSLLSQIKQRIQGSSQSLLLGERVEDGADRRAWGTILIPIGWLLDRMAARYPVFVFDPEGTF